MEIKMKKTNLASRKYPTKKDGYDPVALTRATERVVIRGNKRKYGRLARPLRFYGGITSAQEVGCNSRCKLF